MELRKLYLRNFRGYTQANIDFNEDINVLIGRNDVGKSTIMDALEIFFNGDNRNAIVKAELDDCNVSSSVKEIEVTACFKLRNDERVAIDSSNTTNLLEEHLLNKDGLLEIKKVWDCSKSSLTANSLKVFINAYYPLISNKPFINMKQSELREELERIKENINDYDLINKSKNAEIRNSLYRYYITSNTEFKELNLEIKKIETNEKDFWRKIKEHLPLYFLFQSDRSNSDSDSEVQNPLKIATKKALAELEPELNKIKELVDQTVSKIGEQTITKLKEFDSGIASQLTTKMNSKSWDSLFSFDLESDRGISLNKRGSGVKRLILLSYFRAEAERISTEENHKNIIYGIEEPETAQHPDFQRMIIDSLKTIGTDAKHQVILTTHTPEIAKMVDLNNIIFLKKDSDTPTIIKENSKKLTGIVDTLGILPTIQSKLVICVEGENDVNFLMNVNQQVEEFKQVIDLKKKKISILPLAGSQLIRWVNRNYLENSNVIEFHIYDSDKSEYIDIIDKIKEKNDGRRYGAITKRLEMENYIPSPLISEQFKIELSFQNEEWSNLDVPKYLLEKVLLNIKDSKEREIVIKTILNGSLSKKITKQHLDEMGCFEEVRSWFEEIASLYFNHSNISQRRLATTAILKTKEAPEPIN